MHDIFEGLNKEEDVSELFKQYWEIAKTEDTLPAAEVLCVT